MEFRDLKRQYKKLKTEIDRNIAVVTDSASFISGTQVSELESRLANYIGVKHCISCANGTDAISISLEAYGIGKGDAVFVPDFTFFSSGECPAVCGATPIFVDVRKDTYNIDAEVLEAEIRKVQSEGLLNPRAVIAVDLFGLPADYVAIRNICDRYDLLLLEDGAQGFGGSIWEEETGNSGQYIERKACSFGDISITSFFPAKPLGCYGDGGAIFTDNDRIAELCRSIAVHGKDMEHPGDPMAKYNNIRLGRNSRLDTIQAAVLLAKFEAFQEYELGDVNKVAKIYTDLLKDIDGIMLPQIPKNFYSSWAQYTIQLPDGINRSTIRNHLKQYDIPTMVYYQKPMHLQGAFHGTRSAVAKCPVTEYLCEHVLCLPIHPYLHEDEITIVVERIRDSLKDCRLTSV